MLPARYRFESLNETSRIYYMCGFLALFQLITVRHAALNRLLEKVVQSFKNSRDVIHGVHTPRLNQWCLLCHPVEDECLAD